MYRKYQQKGGLFILMCVYSIYFAHAQKISVGLIGGYQMSFSNYFDLMENRFTSRSYFHNIYGIQGTLHTKNIDLGLWVSHSRFSNELTPKYILTLPSSNLFPTQRRAFPIIQTGLSLSKPIISTKHWRFSMMLTGGMNRSIMRESEPAYPTDTLSNTNYEGTVYLAFSSIPSLNTGNMFLGSGLQGTYQIIPNLALNTEFQYQLGIGLLRGVTTGYRNWGDNTIDTAIINTSTTSGSNLSLRLSLLYVFGANKR